MKKCKIVYIKSIGDAKLTRWGFKNPVGGCKMKEEYKKVSDTIVKWETIGQTVEGKLLSVEDGHNYDNKVYKIQTEEKLVTVFSTTVLASLMATVPIGSDICIEYTGTKENKKTGQNDIKLFDVGVKE